MNKLKQFITARRVSLGLILLLAGLMYISTVIPQNIDSTPEKIEAWRRGHAGLLRMVDFLNLHSIYAQPWFAAAILFAALALGISSYDQLRIVRKKLSSTGIVSSEMIASAISERQLRTVAHSLSYRFFQTGTEGKLKFIKSPWGYFGNLLLHIGITVVITVSLYVALTARQGALILVEGEQREPGQPWNVSMHGILSSPLKLPGAIRLDRVRVQFDNKQQPLEVFSDISIINDTGRVNSLTASINRIQSFHGLRIYHASQYGNAFKVVFTDKNGVSHAETIAAQQPVSLTDPGYCDDFSVNWTPNLLSAKYFADVEKKSMSSLQPELTLRFTREGKEIARTTLTPGETGMLDEFKVQLTGVGRWSKLIIVETTGMPLIFTGFVIIMLGGLLQYLAPPRELIAIRQQDDKYMVYWKAASFREFFDDERNEAAAALQKETAA